jgi:DMSO/TMAO reductase YedYZ molybdopterin-dependent catalytic subunit
VSALTRTTSTTSRPRPLWLGPAVAGVVAAGVSLGVAELVAVATGPRSSPVVAVGQGVIRLTPEPVKEFAISTFGEADKIALLVGTFVLLIVFAALVGITAARRPRLGLAGVALLGLVGAFAAVVDPSGSPVSAVPSLVGGVAGAVALLAMTSSFRRADSRLQVPARADEPAPGADGDRPGLGEILAGRDRSGSGTDRRTFFLTTGVATGAALAAGGAGRALLSRRFDVAAARADITLPRPATPADALPEVEVGVPDVVPWRTADADFYRVDTALVLPQVEPSTWRLSIGGRVRRSRSYTYQELLDRPLIERDITLNCVSNEVGGPLIGNGRWIGVPLAELLDEVEPEDGADQIVSRSVEGMTIGTPTETVRRTEGAMIALGFNGEPLSIERGFPARMLVPGLYGYVSACKWITEMRLTSFAEEEVYWTRRGWEAQAPVKMSSRIDTPRPLSRVQVGQAVPIAGIAWAQTRGISAVEVSIDDGPWQQARLADVPHEDTWRQWVLPWTPEAPGRASLVVRAYDGAGDLQLEERQPIFPNGSSGWHSVVVIVE